MSGEGLRAGKDAMSTELPLWLFDTDTLVAMARDCQGVAEQPANGLECREIAGRMLSAIAAEIAARKSATGE